MTKKPLSKHDQDMINRRLAIALNSGRIDEVRALLQNGADASYRQTGEEPLLSFAAAFDSIEMVALLIEYGADVHACDKAGVTPLECALESAQFDSALLLMKHGASLNFQMVKGTTLPTFAAAILADHSHNSEERTEFVLAHGVDLGLRFTHGKREDCTIVEVLADYTETAHIRKRPVAKALKEMLERHIEAQKRAEEEARMKELRTKRQSDLRKKGNGKYKL